MPGRVRASLAMTLLATGALVAAAGPVHGRPLPVPAPSTDCPTGSMCVWTTPGFVGDRTLVPPEKCHNGHVMSASNDLLPDERGYLLIWRGKDCQGAHD